MRKIFLTMIFILLIQSITFGAVFVQSEDMNVYVRQDIFGAKMEALVNEIRGDIKVLSERMDKNFAILSERIDALDVKLTNKIDAINEKLTKQIDALDVKLTNKIDAVDSKLSARIDGIDKRIDELDKRINDLRNGFYVGIVVFGTLLGLPIFNKLYSERKSQKEKSSFTLEDVKRLIEENNMILRQSLLMELKS